MDKASKALGIVVAVLAAVLVIGVLTFAGPCVHDDGSVATCHSAQLGVIGGAVAALVLALAALFVGGRVAGVLDLLAAVAGMFVAAAPGVVFQLCMMNTMRCHVIMQPFAQFLGVAVAAVALIAGIRALRAASSAQKG